MKSTKSLKNNLQSQHCDLHIFGLPRLCRITSFLPLFARPNSVGEINCFLRRVVMQNDYSLLSGAESSYLKRAMTFMARHLHKNDII